jgi:hypothetical protein
MDDETVIATKLTDALNLERFIAWLEPRRDEMVGRRIAEWACPITTYLNATALGEGLWAYTDSDKVSVYNRDPSAGVDHEALIAAHYLPDWAGDFVLRIDMYGNRDRVSGADCLDVLDVWPPGDEPDDEEAI